MMRVLLTRRRTAFTRPCATDEIDQVIGDHDNLVWVDVIAPTPADFDLLRKEFGFHEMALDDVVQHNERPKLDAYDDFYFLVLYSVEFNPTTTEIDEHEIDIFVGKNYMVTVHQSHFPEVDQLAARWERNNAQLSSSVGVLLYSLIDAMIDDYIPVLDAIADLTEEIEARIFGVFDPGAQAQIFQLKKELLNLRRVLVPERDVLLRLSRRELTLIEGHTEVYFQDVYDHVVRATDSVDLYRDLLNSALDSYLSLSSNQLNIVFRTLTSVSIILMSVTFIAGVYGMNFNPDASPYNMPELNTRYGYLATLAFMAVVAGVLYAIFHRKRWL